MSAANLITVQALAAARLAAAAAFTGLSITLELAEDATPDQLAAAERAFETALATTGLAIVILSPELSVLDRAESAAVSGRMAVPIAICENPEVNRGTADATADPPRSPANKSARELVEAAVAALLSEFDFPAQILGRPTWANGFWAYYLVAEKKHLIRGA